VRLHTLLERGLAVTAVLWPDIRTAYSWVHAAAHLLGHPEGRDSAAMRPAYSALVSRMFQERQSAGELEPAVLHFLKVTQSYWPGLFHCYRVEELPRTNTDLERFFGSARYQERRATGRKRTSPATVVRGAVQLVAAVATRFYEWTAAHLHPHDAAAREKLRQELNARQEGRRVQRRFRRNPVAFLAALEQQYIRSLVPP
jgi:hypothetical protein